MAVDNQLSDRVRKLRFFPGIYLLSHAVEVALHFINTDRQRVRQREILGVFGQDGQGVVSVSTQILAPSKDGPAPMLTVKFDVSLPLNERHGSVPCGG